jgi:hypothetical protein
VKEKICVRCKEGWPPDTDFYKTPESPKCIACESESQDWRKYRTPEHMARRREYQRAYHARKNAEKKGAPQ